MMAPLLSLLLLLAPSAWAQCQPNVASLMDRMAFAESVGGDCHELLSLADQALACVDSSASEIDLINYRKALCLYALGKSTEALRLLDEVSTASNRSPVAARQAHQLITLLDTRRAISSLPYSPDLTTVPITIATRDPGAETLSIQPLQSGGKDAALVWRTLVASDEADYLTIPVATSLATSVLTLDISSRDLPVALYLYLVLDDGERFLGEPIEVLPEDGWTQVRRSLESFTLYPGGGPDTSPDLDRVRYIMIQDATGFVFDYTGTHRILFRRIDLHRGR